MTLYQITRQIYFYLQVTDNIFTISFCAKSTTKLIWLADMDNTYYDYLNRNLE